MACATLDNRRTHVARERFSFVQSAYQLALGTLTEGTDIDQIKRDVVGQSGAYRFDLVTVLGLRPGRGDDEQAPLRGCIQNAGQ